MDKTGDYLPKIFRGNESVLDLGCGVGFYAEMLWKYASKLYCIDLNREALKAAEEKLRDAGNIYFVAGEASKLPLKDAFSDVVFMANFLHDVGDKESTYMEILRVLNVSGRVVIVDWSKKLMLWGPPLKIRMSEDDYLKLFRDFRLVMRFQPSPDHYGLVLERIKQP